MKTDPTRENLFSSLVAIRSRSLPLEKVTGAYGFTLVFLQKTLLPALMLKSNRTIELVLATALTQRGRLYLNMRRPSIELFFIGRFRRKYHILGSIAKALAPFYLEMQTLPDVHLVSYQDIAADPTFIHGIIKRGVILYDRERSIS